MRTLFVPQEDRVRAEGEGFRTLLSGLNAERVMTANAALGIGRAALRRASEYAKQLIDFGRPIGQNQGSFRWRRRRSNWTRPTRSARKRPG